ncbi:MAG: hypothetical protein WBI17_12780 [Clostridiaceae bacterium]
MAKLFNLQFAVTLTIYLPGNKNDCFYVSAPGAEGFTLNLFYPGHIYLKPEAFVFPISLCLLSLKKSYEVNCPKTIAPHRIIK